MLQPGSTLGKYRIISRIGTGGMSDVYRVEDIEQGKELALKVLPPELARDKVRIRRFYKEVRATEKLQHANIVAMKDVAEADGYYFYTMDLAHGGNLKSRIEHGMTPEDALQVMIDISSALIHAHEKGFIHRDIKPGNILFQNDGTALLTDFGIVKVIGRCTVDTKTGMSIGTPHYMSPEQARGKNINHSTDLYSLGIVFYEMLTGQVPFDAEESIAVALMHLKETPRSLPRNLRIYQPIINKLLAKNEKKRFENAAVLHKAVVKLQAKTAQQSPQKTQLISHVQQKPFARTKWAAGGGILAMFIMIAVISAMHEETSFIQNNPADHGLTAFDQTLIQKQNDMVPAESSSEVAKDDTSNDISGAHPQRNKDTDASPILTASTSPHVVRPDTQSPKNISPPPTAISSQDDSSKQVTEQPPRLVIQSKPSGSDVYIDDRLVGQTPLDTDAILPGQYLLRIEKEYFVPMTTEVKLEPGMEMKNMYDLEPGIGAVQIKTTPPAATVWLDGDKQEGVTPLTITDITAGIHQLRIHKDKYYDVKDAIEIKHDMKLLDEIVLKGGNLVQFEGKWLSPEEYAMVEQDRQQTKSRDLLALAKKASDTKDWQEAEKLYSKILFIDSYNTDAFSGLEAAMHNKQEQNRLEKSIRMHIANKDYDSALIDLKELEMLSHDLDAVKQKAETVKQMRDDKRKIEELAEKDKSTKEKKEIPIVW